MSKQGAERAVVISALVVFGIYFYRHLTEGTDTSSSGGVGQLIGLGTPASIGKFITAWGFVFFVLSIVTEAAPGLGGAFAILAATGDALANTTQIAKDVNTKLGLNPAANVKSVGSAASSIGAQASNPGVGVTGTATA